MLVTNCHLTVRCALCQVEGKQFSKELAKVILSFYDNLLLRRVNINVDQFGFHAQCHVYQVGKVAFWLIYGISRVYDALNFIRFDQSIYY